MDTSSADMTKNMPHRPKVFLVEDEAFIVRAYKDTLEREDFVVEVASDGEEAMLKVRDYAPDIILLDLILPIKNGFEVLEALHADSTLKNIPVIILTNLGQESDMQKGRELGAVDYFIKSNISLKDIVQRIRFRLTERRTAS